MLRKIRNLFYELPLWVDTALRWWDLKAHRTDCTRHHAAGFVTGYSSLALWLPIPVILVFAYGLPRWRGWLVLCAALVAIADHLLICWLARGRRLPQAQWALLTFLAVALFGAGLYTGGTQAGAGAYPHLFALFGAVMLALGMPFSRAWADWLIGRERERFREQFAARLQKTQLFVNYDAPPRRPIRVVRSFLMVPFSSLLMLAIVPAIFVLVSHPDRVRFWAVTSLVLWWAFLAFGHYQERLKASHTIVRQMFLVGGATVVSLIVILFALTRLLGVSYVTTVLDQTTRWTVAASIAILYLVIWLYDYWLQRARAEVLLGFLTDGDDHPCCVAYRDDRLQIHGAGRFVALRDDPAKGFEPYPPLEVFEKIVEQLEGRVRSEEIEFRKLATSDAEVAGTGASRAAMKKRWKEVDAAADALDALAEKSRLYSVVPALLVGLVLAIGVPGIFTRDQRPSLETPTPAAGPQAFDLERDLRAVGGDDAVYAVAASGGGTRAALYSYALLRALYDRQALERVALVSSVSGGSAGAAYFAAHRDALLRPGADAEWDRFQEALAADHIRRVLAGVLEWRFVAGERVGRLLTESFDESFFTAGDGGCRTLRCARVGLIFNTSVTGSWRAAEPHSERCLEERGRYLHCATVESSGSRLVITNVEAMTAESVATATRDWPLDFTYEVVHDSGSPLTTAASLSANFPPVFSNAAVHLDRGTPGERRYWVTDGGAVENRGLVSALLALRAQARRWLPAGALEPRAECAASSPAAGGAFPEPPPPTVKILVAEASGFSRPYKEDRGIGAAGSAASRLANKLIAELVLEVQTAWRVASRCRSTVEIVYLPMPEVFRSGFGTHWQMPKGVELRDPAEWYRADGGRSVFLDEEDLKEALDLIFATPERRDAWAAGDADRTEAVKWMTADGQDDVRLVLDRALAPAKIAPGFPGEALGETGAAH